jgi:hypothetical protein
MTCIYAAPVGAAGTVNSAPFRLQRRTGYRGITAQCAFTYGSSGGTSVDVTLQTSLDSGATFTDVWHVSQLLLASKRFVVNLPGAAAIVADYDATVVLGAGAAKDGVLGDQLRVKVVVVGAYIGASIQVDVFGEAMTQLAE